MFAAIPEKEPWGVPLLDRDLDTLICTSRRNGVILIWVDSCPKAFQNLRGSNATDLVSHPPTHVVSGWTGDFLETRKKLYQQVTDEHRDAVLQVKPQLLLALTESSGYSCPVRQTQTRSR
ncbi:hypothetical protein N9D23_12510 [Rubripirellula sp.]|jgi:hypothetical protein|nr:hypothetical protein [Planctomycetaceae bacterium]MDA9858936.1 hypothetical protein [Rubripirellula sp.]